MTATNNLELQILLVEDNPTDAELTLDALRDAGMTNKVQWVKDGAEALDVLFGGDANAAAESRRRIPRPPRHAVPPGLCAECARRRTRRRVGPQSTHPADRRRA